MPRERKAILICGTVLLLLGAIYRFYPLMEALFADSSEKLMKLERIEKYRQRLTHSKQDQQRIVELNRELGSGKSLLLEGSTTAIGAVHIQNVINEIAYENELTIDSQTVKKAKAVEDIEGFVEVPVALRLKASLRQMFNLLKKLESAPQLLSITEIEIRRSIQQQDDDLLAVNMTICGYMEMEAP